MDSMWDDLANALDKSGRAVLAKEVRKSLVKRLAPKDKAGSQAQPSKPEDNLAARMRGESKLTLGDLKYDRETCSRLNALASELDANGYAAEAMEIRERIAENLA